MVVIEKDNAVYVEGVTDFNTDHIFDCGQCFRWAGNHDGSYTGTAHGQVVKIAYDEAGRLLKIYNTDKAGFEEIWKEYLDLDRDYSTIKKKLREKDRVIAEAIDFGGGIRILNQEKWETLLSFIISQNNNIPRIKKCIDSLAQTLGEAAGEYEGKRYYSLPSPEVLASAKIDDLAPCRLGYRAKYLIETAKQVCEEGIEELEKLGSSLLTSEIACETLRKYSGVGPKVANCIALFSMKKIDSFPIDVWVRKVMNTMYGMDENDLKGMRKFAEERFGEYGGIAQQYLFYYITHNKILKIG